MTQPPDNIERRLHPREPTNLRARAFYGQGLTLWADCTILDLSQGGARLQISSIYPLPPRFVLLQLLGGMVYDVRIRWRRGDMTGVAFDDRRSIEAATAAGYTEIQKAWSALKAA